MPKVAPGFGVTNTVRELRRHGDTGATTDAAGVPICICLSQQRGAMQGQSQKTMIPLAIPALSPKSGPRINNDIRYDSGKE